MPEMEDYETFEKMIRRISDTELAYRLKSMKFVYTGQPFTKWDEIVCTEAAKRLNRDVK